jgi:hypothetical protein
MAERVERVGVLKERVLLQVTGFQQSVELSLCYPLGVVTVPVLQEEQEAVRS